MSYAVESDYNPASERADSWDLLAQVQMTLLKRANESQGGADNDICIIAIRRKTKNGKASN
jgi:hypothetical protein